MSLGSYSLSTCYLWVISSKLQRIRYLEKSLSLLLFILNLSIKRYMTMKVVFRSNLLFIRTYPLPYLSSQNTHTHHIPYTTCTHTPLNILSYHHHILPTFYQMPKNLFHIHLKTHKYKVEMYVVIFMIFHPFNVSS